MNKTTNTNTSSRSIGVGVIGCGSRIRVVLREMQAQADAFKILRISDPRPEALADMQEGYPTAQAVDDYQSLVNDPAIDWVMIGSWNCFHREHAVAAFRAGKHVFCEKPLATNLEDCLAMREAWLASGKQFIIGFTLRYSPHYRKIKALLNEGQIGDIISMEFNETLHFNHGGYIMGDWRRRVENAGSHLLEKCSHDIDLANWMAGSRAAHVASFAGLDFFTPENRRHVDRIGPDSDGSIPYSTWKNVDGVDPFLGDKTIHDNQVVILEYENGVRATFHTNMNAGIPERRMYICGTEGAIRADVLSGQIELKRIGFKDQLQQLEAGASGGHGGGDAILGTNIVHCMLGREEPYTGLEDGLASAVTCFAVDESVAQRRMVDVGDYWKRIDQA